jgi:hypothetical protein
MSDKAYIVSGKFFSIFYVSPLGSLNIAKIIIAKKIHENKIVYCD